MSESHIDMPDVASAPDVPTETADLGDLNGDDPVAEFLREALEGIYAYRSDAQTAQEAAEHKRPDRDLRGSNERLARVLDSIPVGVTVVDTGGQILFANEEAERILRLTRSRIAGIAYDDPMWQPLRIISNWGDTAEFAHEEKLIVRAIERGETVHGVEAYVTSPNYVRRIPIRISVAPLGGNGKVLGMVTAFQDISEEQELRMDRQRTRTFLGRMLAACTRGSLQLVENEEDLPERLSGIGEPVALTDAAAHQRVRESVAAAAQILGFEEDRLWDLVTAVGEACHNAMQHGMEGVAAVCASRESQLKLQIWVEDRGPVSNDISLPDYSEEWTERFAPGFSFITAGCDRVYLYVGPQRTTLVLEAGPLPPVPGWMRAGRHEEYLTESEKAFLRARS